MGKSFTAMASCDHCDRLDRQFVLFCLAGSIAKKGTASSSRCAWRIVECPWWRVLSCAEVSRCTHRYAEGIALVQIRKLFHLDQWVFATRRDLLLGRTGLSHRFISR